jgi:hypothetical protein
LADVIRTGKWLLRRGVMVECHNGKIAAEHGACPRIKESESDAKKGTRPLSSNCFS